MKAAVKKPRADGILTVLAEGVPIHSPLLCDWLAASLNLGKQYVACNATGIALLQGTLLFGSG
jgi:hypothetical protein